MARRTMLGLTVVLIFMVFALPACGAPLTVFRLIPMIGWATLEEVNPYATIDSDRVMELASPMTGLRNAESSVVQITARATIALDTGEAGISADFIPVSGEIVEVGGRLFAAPIGRQLKGTIVLTVRNPNDFPMESANVEGSVGSAFQPTVTGRSQGNVRLESNDPRGLSAADNTAFIWNVGSLMPNEAARCEISVTTRRNSSGGFGFSKEGSYTIDSGFLLTYTMRGKTQRQRTAPHSIIAQKNPKSLGPNAGSSDVVSNSFERQWPYPERTFPERSSTFGPGSEPSETTENESAKDSQGSGAFTALVTPLGESVQIERIHGSGLFSLLATGISENIGVEDDKFTVPTGEAAEWKVELWVNHPDDGSAPEGWNGWIVTLLFGEHLAAEEIERLVYVPDNPDIQDGILTIEVYYPAPDITRVRVIWYWHQTAKNRFLPGSHAYLALKVTTEGLPPSSEDLIFCKPINMEYNPVGSGYWHQVPLETIYIKAVQEAYADVNVTASRLDWRVQKPGTYAAIATEISATGKGDLSVQFSEFNDLTRTDGLPGSIPAFYAFGEDLPSDEAWTSASELNDPSGWLEPITLNQEVQSTVRMWSKISVDGQDSSAEYENEGVITFIVGNMKAGGGQ